MAVTVDSNKIRRVGTRAQGGLFNPNVVKRGTLNARGEVEKPSNLGKAIAGFGDQIGAIALEMQNEDNETHAKEADSRIAASVRAITIGDPNDPQGTPGYLTTQGETALKTFGGAEEALRASMQAEVEAAGRNRALLALIEQKGQQRINKALDRMSLHASEQRLKHQENVSLAREAQAITDVVSDFNNDDAISDALGTVQAEVLDRAEAAGFNDEQTAVALASRQSLVVKAAFDAALTSGDVSRAQAVFSAHSSKLDGPTRQAMADALSKDVEISGAQSLAQEAWSKFRNDPAAMRAYIRDAVDGKQESAAIAEINGMLSEVRSDQQNAIALENARRAREREDIIGGAQKVLDDVEARLGASADPLDMLEYIQENYSGKEEDAAISLLSSRLSLEKAIEQGARVEADHLHKLAERAKKQEEQDALSTVHEYLYQDTPAGQEPPTLRQFRRENPQVYDILARNDQIDSLVVTERNIREGRIYATSSDGETLNQIRLMPYQERARLTDGRLAALRTQLTESEFKQASSAVASAQAKVQGDERDRGIYNAGEAALRDFAPVGFDPNGSAKARRQFQAADNALENWITQRIRGDSYPSLPEIKAEAARLMMMVEADSGLFSGIEDFDEAIAASAGSMTPEQRAIATVEFEKIPKVISDQLLRAVQADWTGVDPDGLTEEVMENLAGAVAMGDVQRLYMILRNLGGTPKVPLEDILGAR